MLSAVGLLLAAGASLATTDIDCPKVAVSRSDAVALEANASAVERYRATASSPVVRVLVSATSEGTADVRVRLEPDPPALFAPDPRQPDAGVIQSADLAIVPGLPSTAELTLPSCAEHCEAFEFSLIAEHLAGTSAALRWDVIVETADCGDNFHARIDRL